ncbi:hypothetical protein HBI25_028190 [Parastagonospora nodorum]|nr:hypothetical protein HBH50_080820 [Parastagonospora nodorum]KAH4094139.1 hypothetical protein HBH48_069070 [Parastagonospora nodorum]KAH4109758.1 hypothetical protein HBH46_026090 [Parastagonospora nodorum]KAH4196868.1 hypothetical protein HBH42_071190 [Parastagonospora nodorum]KAH4818407.1 hypothetical protein HBH61_039660 [Parastagonospora nodorum]
MTANGIADPWCRPSGSKRCRYSVRTPSFLTGRHNGVTRGICLPIVSVLLLVSLIRFGPLDEPRHCRPC